MKLYENFSNKYANYKDIEQKLYRMNEDVKSYIKKVFSKTN